VEDDVTARSGNLLVAMLTEPSLLAPWRRRPPALLRRGPSRRALRWEPPISNSGSKWRGATVSSAGDRHPRGHQRQRSSVAAGPTGIRRHYPPNPDRFRSRRANNIAAPDIRGQARNVCLGNAVWHGARAAKPRRGPQLPNSVLGFNPLGGRRNSVGVSPGEFAPKKPRVNELVSRKGQSGAPILRH